MKWCEINVVSTFFFLLLLISKYISFCIYFPRVTGKFGRNSNNVDGMKSFKYFIIQNNDLSLRFTFFFSFLRSILTSHSSRFFLNHYVTSPKLFAVMNTFQSCILHTRGKNPCWKRQFQCHCVSHVHWRWVLVYARLYTHTLYIHTADPTSPYTEGEPPAEGAAPITSLPPSLTIWVGRKYMTNVLAWGPGSSLTVGLRLTRFFPRILHQNEGTIAFVFLFTRRVVRLLVSVHFICIL